MAPIYSIFFPYHSVTSVLNLQLWFTMYLYTNPDWLWFHVFFWCREENFVDTLWHSNFTLLMFWSKPKGHNSFHTSFLFFSRRKRKRRGRNDDRTAQNSYELIVWHANPDTRGSSKRSKKNKQRAKFIDNTCVISRLLFSFLLFSSLSWACPPVLFVGCSNGIYM